MGDVCIITGWGYEDYAFAAATALRKYPHADVVPLSKRRLPEFLAGLAERDVLPERLLLVGVSVSHDLPRAANALHSLAKRGTNIICYSALVWGEHTLSALGNSVETHIHQDQPLAEIVSAHLGIGVPKTAKWHPRLSELLEAGALRYRRIQDTSAYVRVIRHIGETGDPLPRELEHLLNEYRLYGDRELKGVSQATKNLWADVKKLGAASDCRILIVGETGTGKETVAGLIHQHSSRRLEPLIFFNCADLSPQLLESRLFGHEKGAFTGATGRKPGAFELANGGTLFLDEIGELSAEAQAGLLRVLQEGRFYRIGGVEDVSVDVRIVSATNCDLPSMVREGRFREDLFYRISTVVVELPPLRERPEDIAVIATDFWKKLTGHRSLSDRQLADLADYSWPGNVRELRNLLERAYALGETDFGKLLARHRQWLGDNCSPKGNDYPDNLAETTRLHIQRVLDKNDGNITQAAHALGVARNTVKKHLKGGTRCPKSGK